MAGIENRRGSRVLPLLRPWHFSASPKAPKRISSTAAQPRTTSRTLKKFCLVSVGLLPLLQPAVAADAATAITLYVSSTGLSTNNCTSLAGACLTIQEGITAGETYSSSDVTVEIAPGTYNESDVINVPIGDTLTLQGSTTGLTAANGGGLGSVFTISGGTAAIDAMSIGGGSAALGGGVFNNGGSVTLNDDTIFASAATNNGGGVYNQTDGSTLLTNDTISGDSATNSGGGIYNNGGTVTAVSVTFSSDSAGVAGGGVDNVTGGTTTIANSILDVAPCAGAIGDGGHNVESDNSCGFGSTDVVNSSSINLASALATNGSSGPETLAINTNSAAFAEVPIVNCTTSSDERGDPRPGDTGANCDAGAYEDQLGATSLNLIGSPSTGDNVFSVTLTVPSGGPAPSETAVIKDSDNATCEAILSESTSTTYVGSCIIDNELAGETVTATYDVDDQDTNYAGSASNSLTIEPGNQSITFTSVVPTSPTVGKTYAVTATGGKSTNPVTFSIDAASTSGACTASGSTVTFVELGTCLIDANQAATTTFFAATQVQQSVSINTLGAQSIIFTSKVPTSPKVGTTYAITATGGASTNPIIFTIDIASTSGACTVSGSTVTFVAVGTCLIDANQAANTNYLAAPQVQQSVTVLAAGSIPPVTTGVAGARVVILQNSLARTGASFREMVKLACRNVTCAGLVKSVGQISITRDVSIKSGPWTVTKKVTKVTKVILAKVNYRLAAGKSELLALVVSAGGRSVLVEAKATAPVRETLTATAADGNTATSNVIVR